MLKHKSTLINQPSLHTQKTYSTHTYIIIKIMFCNVKEYLWALPDICHASSLPVQAALKLQVPLQCPLAQISIAAAGISL